MTQQTEKQPTGIEGDPLPGVAGMTKLSDHPAILPPPTREVVIPTLAGIGNSVMTVPLVRQLHGAFPDVKLTIATRTRAIGEVFRRLDAVNEVVQMGPGAPAAMESHREIRRRDVDVYLVPHPNARWQYTMLAMTSGARWTVLHHYPSGYWRGLRFLPRRRTVRLRADRHLHDVVQLVRMLRVFGIEPDEHEPPVFPVFADDCEQADALLADLGIARGEAFVAVMSGCAQTVMGQQKRWPPDRFARVIEALHARHGLRAVVIEGPDERGLGRLVREAIGDTAARSATVVAELRGSLGVSAALLSRARLFVGNDSALAHIAAAVGVVPVTIFGAGDPVRVCPFGYRDLVVTPGAEWKTTLLYPFDSPLPKMRDDGVRWVEQIEPSAVLEKVELALTREPVVPHSAGG